MKNFIVIPVLLLMINCHSQKYNIEDENTYEILSFLINKYAKPIAPPPPLDISDHTSDSIKRIQTEKLHNKKMTVAIYPTMNPLTEKLEIDTLNLDELDNFTRAYPIEIPKIDYVNNYNLILADTLRLKKNSNFSNYKYFHEFDILLQFSRIAFDQDKTRAIVIMSYNYSPLNGGSVLLFLKKFNGKWHISKRINLEIS